MSQATLISIQPHSLGCMTATTPRPTYKNGTQTASNAGVIQ